MFHPWRRTPRLAFCWLVLCISLTALLAGANAFFGLLVGVAVAPAIPYAVDSMAVPHFRERAGILEQHRTE